MRKIRAQLFISLDGVVDRLEEWHFRYFDDELGAAVDATLATADTLLLGRKTYESFAGAWPPQEEAGGEDAEFARHLGDARKIVVSSQKLEFSWRNTEQVTGDFIEAVAALKEETSDTHIAVSGSISVVRQLLAGALLDELHLLIHPIAAGHGTRLFDGLSAIPLTLRSSDALTSGVLNVLYAPEGAP